VARGVVNNITNHTINQQAIQEAENNSGYKIKDVVVGIGTTHPQYSTYRLHQQKQSRRGYWRMISTFD
jgi:cell division ATPase FtsA